MLRSLRSFVMLLASVTAVAIILGCDRAPAKIILQREWTANAEYAGDIWAKKLAAARRVDLEVREGSEVLDPVKLVRSNKAHFGVASADRILRENEGGAELVVLATATYRSPVVFLPQANANVTTPRDFVGKTIGLQAGTNTELVFKALARAQGLPLQSLKIVESGWGTKTFETGAIDVLGAFAYDEPVALELSKHPFGAPIKPEDYGVRFVGTVYFTRKALIAEHPEVVQTFVDLLVEGWRSALSSPGEAIDLLASQFPGVRESRVKEARSLEAGRPYFTGDAGRILYASKDRWEDMARTLIELGLLKSFVFGANIDYRFLDKASTR